MASGDWKQVNLPPEFRAMWEKANGAESTPRAYQTPKGLTALVGRENLGVYDDPDLRWHISLRYGDRGVDGRVPSWEELVASAHELRPGVCFVVGVPPKSWWMNVHPDVLHLHETRDEALIAEYRRNAAGQVPT